MSVIVKSIMTKEINEDGYWLDLNSMYAILFLLGRSHQRKQGFPKGELSPFGTQPCLQGVVCYTALPTDGKNSAATRLGSTIFIGRKTGRNLRAQSK